MFRVELKTEQTILTPTIDFIKISSDKVVFLDSCFDVLLQILDPG